MVQGNLSGLSLAVVLFIREENVFTFTQVYTCVPANLFAKPNKMFDNQSST